VGSLYGCRMHVPLLDLNFDTRTTFLISPESELVHVFHHVDPHTAAAEVLRALQALVALYSREDKAHEIGAEAA
jgi:peroxiredoxin